LLPKPKHTGYDLRPREHGYELPAKDEDNYTTHAVLNHIGPIVRNKSIYK